MALIKGLNFSNTPFLVDLDYHMFIGGYLHNAENLEPIFGLILNRTENPVSSHFIGRLCSNRSAISLSMEFLLVENQFFEYDLLNNQYQFTLWNNYENNKLNVIKVDLKNQSISKDYLDLVSNQTVFPNMWIKLKNYQNGYIYVKDRLLYLLGIYRIPSSGNTSSYKLLLDEINRVVVSAFNESNNSCELHIIYPNRTYGSRALKSTGSAYIQYLPTYLRPIDNNGNYEAFVFYTTTASPVFERFTINLNSPNNPTYETWSIVNTTDLNLMTRLVLNTTPYRTIDNFYITDKDGNEYVLTIIEERWRGDGSGLTNNNVFLGILLWKLDRNSKRAILIAYSEIQGLIRLIPYGISNMKKLSEFIAHTINGIFLVKVNYNPSNPEIIVNPILVRNNISSILIDSLGRIWYYINTQGIIDIILPSYPVKVDIRLPEDVNEYSGKPINTYLIVNIYDINNNRLQQRVQITAYGNVEFLDSNNNTIGKVIQITTNPNGDTLVPIVITGAGVINFVLSFV